MEGAWDRHQNMCKVYQKVNKKKLVPQLHAICTSHPPDIPLLGRLLATGIDVNKAQKKGVPLLHAAAQHRAGSGGGGAGLQSWEESALIMVALLLVHGADTARKDAQGRTAAETALTALNTKVAAMLYAKDAILNALSVADADKMLFDFSLYMREDILERFNVLATQGRPQGMVYYEPAEGGSASGERGGAASLGESELHVHDPYYSTPYYSKYGAGNSDGTKCKVEETHEENGDEGEPAVASLSSSSPPSSSSSSSSSPSSPSPSSSSSLPKPAGQTTVPTLAKSRVLEAAEDSLRATESKAVPNANKPQEQLGGVVQPQEVEVAEVKKVDGLAKASADMQAVGETEASELAAKRSANRKKVKAKRKNVPEEVQRLVDEKRALGAYVTSMELNLGNQDDLVKAICTSLNMDADTISMSGHLVMQGLQEWVMTQVNEQLRQQADAMFEAARQQVSDRQENLEKEHKQLTGEMGVRLKSVTDALVVSTEELKKTKDARGKSDAVAAKSLKQALDELRKEKSKRETTETLLVDLRLQFAVDAQKQAEFRLQVALDTEDAKVKHKAAAAELKV